MPENAMYSSKFNAAIREGIHAIVFMFDASDPRNDYHDNDNDNDLLDARNEESSENMGQPNTKTNASSFGHMLRMHDHFESYLTHEISIQQQSSPSSQQQQSRPRSIHKVCVAGSVDGLSNGHDTVSIHR